MMKIRPRARQEGEHLEAGSPANDNEKRDENEFKCFRLILTPSLANAYVLVGDVSHFDELAIWSGVGVFALLNDSWNNKRGKSDESE
jgi:hypothetical protein